MDKESKKRTKMIVPRSPELDENNGKWTESFYVLDNNLFKTFLVKMKIQYQQHSDNDDTLEFAAMLRQRLGALVNTDFVSISQCEDNQCAMDSVQNYM